MLICDNLKYIYKNSGKGLKNLNVSLEKENVYGLLGKNGSGKTTLLHIISSLLFSQSGICSINNIPVNIRDPKILENFFIFPEDLFDISMTAQKFVHSYSMFYPHFDREYFQMLLEDLDIEDSISRPLNKVSLGQRKKVFVAFALATKSKILLFDEPTNGLDIPSRTVLKNIIHKNAYSNNQIVLISTHNIKDIENLVGSYIFIDEGEHLFTISTETIFKNFSLKKYDSTTQEKAICSCEVFGGSMFLFEDKKEILTEFDLEVFFTMALKEPVLQDILANLEQPVSQNS